MTTYSLAEAAELICGSESRAKWLANKLRNGQLPGYKVGRSWRLTESDVAAAIEALRPKPIQVPAVPVMTGLTRTSQRRLSA